MVKYKSAYSSCKNSLIWQGKPLNLVISSERIEWHTIYERCIEARGRIIPAFFDARKTIMTTKLVLIVTAFKVVLSETKQQIQRSDSNSGIVFSFHQNDKLLVNKWIAYIYTNLKTSSKMGWNHRRCMCLTISVLNYLLLKVIVPAAWMKSVANMLRLSPQSQALWGLLWMSFSLYDFFLLFSNNGEITSRERKIKDAQYVINSPQRSYIKIEFKNMMFFKCHYSPNMKLC